MVFLIADNPMGGNSTPLWEMPCLIVISSVVNSMVASSCLLQPCSVSRLFVELFVSFIWPLPLMGCGRDIVLTPRIWTPIAPPFIFLTESARPLIFNVALAPSLPHSFFRHLVHHLRCYDCLIFSLLFRWLLLFCLAVVTCYVGGWCLALSDLPAFSALSLPTKLVVEVSLLQLWFLYCH